MLSSLPSEMIITLVIREVFEGACKFNDLEIHVFLRNSYSATVETAYAATYFICDKDSSVVIEVEGLL